MSFKDSLISFISILISCGIASSINYMYEINTFWQLLIVGISYFTVLYLSISALTYSFTRMAKPRSFEACVLYNMEGQNSNLLQIAGKLCRKSFPK